MTCVLSTSPAAAHSTAFARRPPAVCHGRKAGHDLRKKVDTTPELRKMKFLPEVPPPRPPAFRGTLEMRSPWFMLTLCLIADLAPSYATAADTPMPPTQAAEFFEKRI